jgi:kinesin family protein 2/24
MYQQKRQPARKAKDSALDNTMRNSIAYPIRRAEPDEEDEHLNDLLQVMRLPLQDYLDAT